MQDSRMIFPEPFFFDAWRSETITVVEMADIYGTSRAAIYRAAKRFDLGKKNPEPMVIVEEKPRPDTYRDELLWSKGKWSILAEISDKYGRTLTQVQADYFKAKAYEK